MGNNVQRDTGAEQDLKISDIEIDMKWPYIAFIIVCMLILTPMAVAMTYNYYGYKDGYMYNARRPMLVIIFNTVAIAFIGLYIPIHIIVMEIYWDNNAKYEEWWDSAFFFTAQICVFVTFALRTWHSFYDFKLAHSVSSSQWQSILNEKYKTLKEGFYVKYHQTLGEPRKTFLYFLIIPASIYFVAYIIVIAFRTAHDIEYVFLYLAFLYLLSFVAILMYIIRHTWRHVYDNIHLRGEILIGCVVLCTVIALQAIVFVIDIWDYNRANEKYQKVYNFCFSVLSTSACFALIVVSTQYVKIKVNQNEKLQIDMLKKLAPTKEAKRASIVDEDTWIYSHEVDFQALIATTSGLHEFLSHSAKEYQLNYLVFAMEVTQYKTHVIPLLLKKHPRFVQELESSLLEFPDHVPQSTIIYPLDGGYTTERRMFIELFDKYINSSAEWKISITQNAFNGLVDLYRRCKMSRAKAPSVYNRSMYDEEGNPLRESTTFHDAPIASLRQAPISFTDAPTNSVRTGRSRTGSTLTAVIDEDHLRAMVEALDGALDNVLDTLNKSFNKFKMTQQFDSWFARLTPPDRDEMTRKFRHRKLVKDTIRKTKDVSDVKQWECRHCTLNNRAIYVDSRLRQPKNICMCCGHKNDEQNILLRTVTVMKTYAKHSKRRISSQQSQYNINEQYLQKRRSTRKSQSQKPNLSVRGAGHDTVHSVDLSFSDEEKEDFIPAEDDEDEDIEINLDEKIVKLWEEMLDEHINNEEDNTCEGVESEYVDSCPKLQKLQFIMRCYNYYLGKTCECDEDENAKDEVMGNGGFYVKSMSELINNLHGMNMKKLLDIYQHVSSVHFVPDMFDWIEETIGKCGGRGQCKPLQRNNVRKGDRNGQRNERLRDRLNDNKQLAVVMEDNEDEDDDEDDDVKEFIKDDNAEDDDIARFRPLRRQPTKSAIIDYGLGKNGKKMTDEERITLSYLDKWHSFLFHPNVREKMAIEEVKENVDGDNKNNDDVKEDEEEEEIEEDVVINNNAGNNSNKFVTDATKYGSLSKVVSTKLSLFGGKDKSVEDMKKSEEDLNLDGDDNKEDSNEIYYEYGFGSQIKYHECSNHFICMKQELLLNDIHTINEKQWDDTLTKALLCLEMETVEENYRANDHQHAKQYGIKKGELIGIDNVIAILFYCNFDELQNDFSKTFRKMNANDTDSDIRERHIRNFYWLGRALFVAINFYGKRMKKEQVVWHGLSTKMLFGDFATYFDCPTSTTTQKNVAQSFSGNGTGIILKLKSFYNQNCAFMLDVSLFSDFTDECERLFLNETLIITDIYTISSKKWISFKKYIAALLYFNKITTGNAIDNKWNIKETPLIQNTLVNILVDYYSDGVVMRNNDKHNNVPDYIRILFKHYCFKITTPRFDDLDKIQHSMQPRLQAMIFGTKIENESQIKCDGKQKVQHLWVKDIFPNADKYVNDQKETIFMDPDDKNNHNKLDSNDNDNGDAN